MKNKKQFIFAFLLAFTLLFSSGMVSAYGSTDLYIYPGDVDPTDSGAYVETVIDWDSDYPDLKLHLEISYDGGSTWNEVIGSEQWLNIFEDGVYAPNYESSVGGLDSNTEYDVRTVIDEYKDTGGNTYSTFLYSNEVTFTTDYEDPFVEEAVIDNIGQTSADFNSQITDMGSADSLEVYFEYRQAGESFTSTKATGEYSETVTSSFTSFEYSKTGLTAGADYDVRACAYDSTNDVTECGNSATFSTSSINKPSISTLSPSDVTVSSARLRGELNSLGDYSDVDLKYVYSLDGISFSDVSGSQTTLSSPDTYSYVFDNLQYNTNYDYALSYYDEQDSTWVRGNTESFTTAELGEPTISNTGATDVLSNSATLNANIQLGDWKNATVLFSYRKTDLGSFTSTTQQDITNSTNFNETITGLDNNTEYEYQAEITSYCDSSGSCFSESKVTGLETFTTLGTGSIEIKTLNVTSINSQSAIFNSKLSDVNENTIGIFWEYRKKESTSWISTVKTVISSPDIDDEFSKEITDLDPNTEYEVKAGAYSYNLDNNYYGNVKTFITSSPPWQETDKQNFNSPQEFYSFIQNLNPDTEYEFRAIMEGENITKRGNVRTFTTDLIAPEIVKDLETVELGFEETRDINLNSNYLYWDTYTIQINGENIYSNTNITNEEGEVVLNVDIVNNVLELKSFDFEGNFDSEITLSNDAGSTVDEFTINVEPSSFEKVINSIVNIFPDEEKLSTAQKIGYVLITLLVITVVLVAIGVTTGGISKGILILTAVLDFLLIIFYTAIGYISIGILIALILVAIGVAYLKIRGGSE